MEKNNNNLQADITPSANGHALPNGNGAAGGVAEPLSWNQRIWNTWDAFADVMWFIICSIGYILQVSQFEPMSKGVQKSKAKSIFVHKCQTNFELYMIFAILNLNF